MMPDDVIEAAKHILQENDRGTHTIPAAGLYPHQWLWDSCFIAIGMRHYDINRAKKEIVSLLRGQWTNGMLPHMIFSDDDAHRQDRNIWRSWGNIASPDDVATSGITQPPMVAEAVVQIGKKLSKPERRTWYQTVFQALLNYHQWLYDERDPHSEGLILQVHPWETGLDNTPPWMQELHEHQMPTWIEIARRLHLESTINMFRRDTKYVPAEQRLSAIDSLALYSVQRRLRRKNYVIAKILSHSLFAIEDLAFNAIFIRANKHLFDIAKTIHRDIPDPLKLRMQKTETAFEQLWDAYSGQYYSRNFVTHKLIKVPTFATLMPLYAGCITPERAEQLVKLLDDTQSYNPNFPVPTVPINSPDYKELAYWQGPTWININWLLIQGLETYGFSEQATRLRNSCQKLIETSGFYEYFSALNAQPSGIPNFSWTAALMIDLLSD